MSGIVFDASVALAILQDEPGLDEALQWPGRAVISTVNVAEVATVLSLKGLPLTDIHDVIARLKFHVVPFSQDLAELTGFLRKKTITAGLSLGDRACIALAMHRQLPVLTADRAWATLEFGIPVKMLR